MSVLPRACTDVKACCVGLACFACEASVQGVAIPSSAGRIQGPVSSPAVVCIIWYARHAGKRNNAQSDTKVKSWEDEIPEPHRNLTRQSEGSQGCAVEESALPWPSRRSVVHREPKTDGSKDSVHSGVFGMSRLELRGAGGGATVTATSLNNSQISTRPALVRLIAVPGRRQSCVRRAQRARTARVSGETISPEITSTGRPIPLHPVGRGQGGTQCPIATPSVLAPTFSPIWRR
ncbi:hypothetical protein LPLAFNJD_LOCUS3745 [Methylorubrum aminovorans]